MKQEDKNILLQDLSARLPYGVICWYGDDRISRDKLRLIDICQVKTPSGFKYWDCYFEDDGDDIPIELVKPYLRPMSSMSNDEIKELNLFGWVLYIEGKESWISSEDKNEPLDTGGYRANLVHNRDLVQILDWLNAHHFDFRNLIECGLAIDCSNLNIY